MHASTSAASTGDEVQLSTPRSSRLTAVPENRAFRVKRVSSDVYPQQALQTQCIGRAHVVCSSSENRGGL